MSTDGTPHADEDPSATGSGTVDEVVDGPPALAGRKDTSQKQVAANRRNAQKSTGPRSKKGKARSARNAETHGAYARQLHPLGSGPFGEYHAEFYDKAAKLIAGFEPEDDLVAELAKRAVDALMKMSRLDSFEAEMSMVTGIPDADVKMLCGDLQRAEFHEMDMLTLKEIAAADVPDVESEPGFLDETNWQHVAELVRDLLTTECSIPGLWDDENQPTAEADWEQAARVILDAALPDPQHRWVWANGLHAHAYAHRSLIEHKTKAFIASRLINGPLSSIERPRNHLWREFNQAVAQIRQIRKMREDLGGDKR